MRKKNIGLLVLVCVATTVMADEDRVADVSPKERATWHLAVHTAARRALEAAEGLQEPDAELLARMHGRLTAAILADVPSHSRRADSVTRCRAAVRELLQVEQDGQMARILEVANEQSPLPVQVTAVRQVAGARYDQVLAKALDAFEAKHVDALFEKARSQAVALERQTVDQRISPPPFAPLDALLTALAGARGFLPADWPPAVQKRLREDLQSYAGRSDVPVLEEVAAYADGIANRMVDGIRQQYGRQLAMADRQFEDGKTQDLHMAAALEAAVLESLDAGLAALPAEDITTGVPLPVYPAFATVKNHIRQKSGVIEAERFAAFLDKTPLLGIAAGELTQQIQSDLAAHRAGKASRTLLLDGIAAARRPLVAAAYAGNAAAADAATAHFAALLAGETRPATAFIARLANGLDALLPTVRGTLADAQYAAAGFTALDALETLPDVLLNEVHATRGVDPETLAAALTFLERGGIAATAGGGVPENLLEEAESRALARITGLVSTASRTINRQLDLLRELESGKLGSLKTDVAAGRPQKEIRKEWEEALQQRWQTMDDQSSPYAALTRPVLDTLDKTVRQLYDSVLQEHMEAIEEQLVKQAEPTVEPLPTASDEAAPVESETPPKPEETPIPPPDSKGEPEVLPEADAGTGASAGGEGEGRSQRRMPDILLVLSGEGADRCSAMLTIAGVAGRIVQELEVGDPAAAADVLFARLEPHLAALRENAMVRSRSDRGWFGLRRSQGPAISVHVVVESNAVRHRMSLLLKRRIEDAMAIPPIGSGKDPASIAIDWQAGLTE